MGFTQIAFTELCRHKLGMASTWLGRVAPKAVVGPKTCHRIIMLHSSIRQHFTSNNRFPVAEMDEDFRISQASSVPDLLDDKPLDRTLHTLVLGVVTKNEMICFLTGVRVRVTYDRVCIDMRKGMRKSPQNGLYPVFNQPIPLYPPPGSTIKVVAKNLFEDGIKIFRWHVPTERAELDAHRLEHVVHKVRQRQQEQKDRARLLALEEEEKANQRPGSSGDKVSSDKESEDPEEMKEVQVEDKSASTSAAQDADNKNEDFGHHEEMKDTSLDASIIDEAADDVKEDSSDKESEDPEEMKEAQVEDKSASISAAQDADDKNEDPDHHEEMKDTSIDASIIDEAVDDVKEDKERDVFKNGQKDGDGNNLDTQKKGVSSEKRIGGSINGTDDGKGEAAGSSEEEIEGPAVKKMKQQALVEGDNKDTQVITLQENLKEPSLKVRSTLPFAC